MCNSSWQFYKNVTKLPSKFQIKIFSTFLVFVVVLKKVCRGKLISTARERRTVAFFSLKVFEKSLESLGYEKRYE